MYKQKCWRTAERIRGAQGLQKCTKILKRFISLHLQRTFLFWFYMSARNYTIYLMTALTPLKRMWNLPVSQFLSCLRSRTTFITSSITLAHISSVTGVDAPMAGLALISNIHGRKSSVSMKSAPYSSKEFWWNENEMQRKWKMIIMTNAARYELNYI